MYKICPGCGSAELIPVADMANVHMCSECSAVHRIIIERAKIRTCVDCNKKEFAFDPSKRCAACYTRHVRCKRCANHPCICDECAH